MNIDLQPTGLLFRLNQQAGVVPTTEEIQAVENIQVTRPQTDSVACRNSQIMSQEQSHPTDTPHEKMVDQYAELASLAGGLAHEIRNPLSSISMNVALLAEELAESQEARDRRLCSRLATVQEECTHLEGILNAFLQFARVGALHLQPTDLSEFTQKFIDFYQPQAEQAKLDISPHLSNNLPLVNLDRSLMRQVLLNLSLNAQQAMPEGGLLELQTYATEDQVFLEFIDTGEGMSAEVQERMFQTFFSQKTAGSGLGLPTAQKIITAHHGTIHCESEPSKGTRFIITLPVISEP